MKPEYQKRSIYIDALVLLCDISGHFIGSFHCLMVNCKIFNVSRYIHASPKGLFNTLIDVWRVKILRRFVSALVRSPLRRITLQLVDQNIELPSETGFVFVTNHSPWKRLLVQWCLEKNIALFIATGEWKHQKNKIRRKGEGYNDLLKIVNHLKNKGKIIIPIDVFNDLNDCPVDFLGHTYNASLFPVRLAKLANVPLITGIPQLANKRINFVIGPRIEQTEIDGDPCLITKNILRFLETEIKKDPSIWRTFHD